MIYHPDNLSKYLVFGIWLIWKELDSSGKGDKWLGGEFYRLSIQYLIVEIKDKCLILTISYLVFKKYLTIVKN